MLGAQQAWLQRRCVCWGIQHSAEFNHSNPPVTAWIVPRPHPDSYVEVLTPWCDCIWTFKEIMKIRWVHKGQALIGDDWSLQEDEETPGVPRHRGKAMGRQPSPSHGERLPEKPNLWTPWSWTFCLQKCENRFLFNPASLWHFVIWRP